jgi:hypothetical protein
MMEGITTICAFAMARSRRSTAFILFGRMAPGIETSA